MAVNTDINLADTEVEALNALRARVDASDGDDLLLRCLMARKFDVDRAFNLLQAYKSELVPLLGTDTIDAGEARAPLEAGELLLPGTHDVEGAAIVVYDAAMHRDQGFDGQQTLRAILYLVDIALQDERAMRNGITIVSFLHRLPWSKLDNNTHKLLLKTLQNNYPARVRSVAVVSPNWTTKAMLRVLRPFMKNKLSSKLRTYKSLDALEAVVPRTALPVSVGGTHAYDHQSWLTTYLASGNAVSALSPVRSRLPSVARIEGKLARRANKLAQQLKYEDAESSAPAAETSNDPSPSRHSINFNFQVVDVKKTLSQPTSPRPNVEDHAPTMAIEPQMSSDAVLKTAPQEEDNLVEEAHLEPNSNTAEPLPSSTGNAELVMNENLPADHFEEENVDGEEDIKLTKSQKKVCPTRFFSTRCLGSLD
ncbi:uncharacterized protein MONBRDRAFT_29638 [Monosiga brevicollis MX1]|uniref:CRAL-TRIO domain-containing protein n=1 Tax=Monosiga brevicollis TaxID=81824 RepID=A9VBP6_MONBE|nr:uncharacterized protein MONBRDRAFT_29638 [Monosiga brevicollis MX1]EDQ84969.1 predicted protein [Monosiga brevicollis MX1]|eukprot:XP_001750139.1 hypothetical protein [Monosiga brevicollis MX1]